MIFKQNANLARAGLLAAVLGLGTTGAPMASAAQSGGEQSAPASETPDVVQKLQQQRQKIQQLASELRQIQKKATQANPELKTQQKEYRDMVFAAMKGEDFNPKSELEDMRGLQSELQGGGDLPKDERQAMMQELQQKRQAFRSRQQQAMQSEDVQKARESLDSRMREAMQEQNPQVTDMIAELNELQQQYRSLLQEMQQGGMQAPQG